MTTMPADDIEPNVSLLGLGCSRIGSFNNPQPLSQSLALVQRAIDLGVTLLDTSNIYGQGDSERTVGRAIGGRRDRVFLVTKGGRSFSAKMRMMRWAKPVLRPLLAGRGGSSNTVTARRSESLRVDWSPGALARALEGSLRRLRVDHVDGYLLHSPPAAVAGDPAVGDALARLKRAGKLRHFGVSCDDRAVLDRALTMPGLSLLQLPWDLIAEIRDTPLAQQIRARGVIVLAREVIRLQADLAPADAVRQSVATPLVSSTLVGTTRQSNLAQLVEAVDRGTR